MGAANAIAAYRTYGRELGDRAMRLLVYMAVVSKDADAEPWCGIGHEALSEFALGRTMPDDPAGRDYALRVVRRYITELADAGAIRTVRRATYGKRGTFPAKYRLYPGEPCSDGRQVSRRPMAIGQSVTDRREAIGQSVAGHRSESGRPQVSNRPTKEEEEEEEQVTQVPQSTREVEGSRNGAAAADNPDVIELARERLRQLAERRLGPGEAS